MRKSTPIVPYYVQGCLNSMPTTQHTPTHPDRTQAQSRRKVISREHCNSTLGVIRAKIFSNKERIQHPQRPLFMFHLSATYVGGGRKAKLNSGERGKISLWPTLLWWPRLWCCWGIMMEVRGEVMFPESLCSTAPQPFIFNQHLWPRNKRLQ